VAGKPDIVHDRVHRSWLDGVLLPNAGRQIGVKIFAPDTERSFLGKSPISRISSKTGTSVYYYHLDHLGSLNIASDDGGNRVQAVTYYPFGEVLTNTGTVDLKYKFTGQEYDPDSKLYYFGARYYDPAIARFLSPDSIVQSPGNPQSLARYSYALNNPLAYIDPTGHFSIGSFFGSLFGGFLGTLTFAFTWNPILAGVVAGGVSGAFSGNLKNIAMGAVMGGLSGALGSVVQANFGAAGSIAMVGIGAGSAVAKGGWSSLAYMGAGMVGGAAGYGLGGYLDQNTAGPYSLGNNAGTTEDNLKANASFPDRCPIPEDVVNDLKPYAYDQNGNPIDLSQMVLHKGLPGWLPNQDALAYTGSSTDIYWNPARLQYPSEYFDAVIGHEAIIHTQQYLTIPGFSSKYFFEMLIHGTGPSNIYEAPAYKLQSTIFNALIIKYSQ